MALAGLLVAGCRQPEPPLRVGCSEWLGYEPLRMADESGHFGDRRIQVLTFPSATDVIRAYRNGTVEVAALTADEALRIVEHSPDHRIVLVCDVSNGADAILARPEFPSVPALRGRRVGVEPDAEGAYVLARALQLSGLTADEVTVVPVETDEHESAYTAGRVDAVVTMDPWRAQLLAAGARPVFDTSRIPGEVVDVLLTRPETIRQHGSELRLLVDGWFRAQEALVARRPGELVRMARRHQVTTAYLEQSLHNLELPGREANRRMLGRSTNSLADALRRLARVMTEQRLAGPLPDPETLLDDALVIANPR